MTTRNLLIEIGTEELPPKALLTLSQAFAREVTSGLNEASLDFETSVSFATPRRLALQVNGLEAKQADISVERFGPAVKAAFDAGGNATKAAEGFARSCGVPVSALEQKDDGKVVKLYFQSTQPGKESTALIPGIVNEALAKLPIPKRMRWGSKRDEFVRPVHWAVLLYGEEVIPATILGVDTDRITYGHRFHYPQAITLHTPDDYETSLEKPGYVIASFDERRSRIKNQLLQKGVEANANVIIDDDLLNEVTALVEWPVALMGSFDRAYLDVPQEALISSMKEHQKCFHLLDGNGKILPHFITLSNLESRDTAQVIAGNERVISPRLADAAFFYNQDRKQPLEARREKLKTVVFQQALGTLYDKSERVRVLAGSIATSLGGDTSLASRAAELGKCDLLTSMVYEFPELQGVMGTYYARADHENDDVALALDEQYMPRFSGDDLPVTATGTVLALAERLDTIAGLFVIGQPPTGSKDPFALRRAALGIIRIVIGKSLELDLSALIDEAMALQPAGDKTSAMKASIYDFFIERLRAWYGEQGISADTFQAVEALHPASLKQFDLRLKAVSHFRTLPEAEALSAANKRVANILAKLDSLPAGKIDASLFSESAEQVLLDEITRVTASVDDSCENGDYSESLKALCSLREVIDSYFNDVMVNVDDETVRHNRLLMLTRLRELFLRIADISRLQIAGP